MRKFIFAAATAVSALAVAAPASAQYWPQPQGYAYGHNANYGQVRSFQARVNQLQRQIERLDRRNRLSNREASELRVDARNLERKLYNYSRNGMSHREHYALEQRLAQLEHRLVRQANDSNRWGRRNYSDRRMYDRDRDGRDDRFENDRGYDHDD